MLTFSTKAVPLATIAICSAIVAIGCGGEGNSGGAGETVNVGIDDSGCTPAVLKLGAGPKNFVITSKSGGAVTEYEILEGTRILGEAENIIPGGSGKFSVNLKAKEYVLYCPGGKVERGKLTVTGSDASGDAVASATRSEALVMAEAGYRKYVQQEADDLATRTKQFVAAVNAGDVPKAKRLFATTREPYERIEPVAESFGSLDPRIDARVNDVEEGDPWTGFHRIEQALWRKNSTAGLDKVADQLMNDVLLLKRRVAKLEFDPAQIANGASELLAEVSKSKITGEEDRYSHTDLWDFAANVEGAREAFEQLSPELEQTDPELVTTINARFDDVQNLLANYESGDGYVSYTELDEADKRKLSQAVDALAEPLSQVSAKVVGG